MAKVLLETSGNVSAAARRLGVPITDLRIMTRLMPELMDAALEAREQALDKAEQVVRQGMNSQNGIERLQAAALMLRSAEARRRGWGKPLTGALAEPTDKPVLKWLEPNDHSGQGQ